MENIENQQELQQQQQQPHQQQQQQEILNTTNNSTELAGDEEGGEVCKVETSILALDKKLLSFKNNPNWIILSIYFKRTGKDDV